ncbi:lipase family protein [Nocardia seriolae]|uniref:Lipase n=2 Tax=Nocardia seriolae TaxID=37332 RepID=A0ABC8B5A3_9NOCA|nr:lipase family protein [Nocardia seriolae]APB01760.1 Triacylglycerol lipase [Nocardia seriolae]QOW32914.1 lipase [Nocardia seriolae]QUN20524.1 lipase [Nocardia seriolae]WKY51916.1 lipase family protein [Nocardia seriolae]WNJ60045.1 lipase family protein [Nocardia seriolae]
MRRDGAWFGARARATGEHSQGFRPWRRAGLIGAVTLLAAVVAVPGTHADIPYPDDDPFYTAPISLGEFENGAILNSRPIAVFGLPLPVAGWQLQYRTTDSAGEAAADVATVLEPPTPWIGPGDRPLLSYQIAEDSLGTRCAPSFALRGGRDFSIATTLLDVPFLAEAIHRGWAVVVSDYEGAQSRFFDGVNSGRGVLDGVRAAKSFAPLGITDASPLGAWGYSGGAFATLWAMQLRASYAPELWFAGVTSGGVPTDLPAVARGVDGSYQAGLAVLILITLARNDSGSGLADTLNAAGHALLAREADSCGGDLVVHHLFRHLDDYSTVPDLLGSPAFRTATGHQELGGWGPDVPLYLYHSNSDDVIPSAGFSALVDRYCELGTTLTAVHSTIPGHNPAALGEALGAMNFLSDRFAGVPVVAGCTVR